MDYVELLGYAAMAFVGLSFVLKDVIKLRLINAIGCVLFVIYGFFIGSIPVMVMNLFVALLNFYFVFKNWHRPLEINS